MWSSCPCKDRVFSRIAASTISAWTPGRGTRRREAANTTSSSAPQKEIGPGNWQPEGKLLPHTPLLHKPAGNKEHSVRQNKQKCSFISNNYVPAHTTPLKHEQHVAILPSGHAECCSWRRKTSAHCKQFIYLWLNLGSYGVAQNRKAADAHAAEPLWWVVELNRISK